MATVTNWIDHLSASEVQGAVYPGVGSEGILVILGFIIWIGWHVITAKQESEKLQKLARQRRGPNDWKSNITDGQLKLKGAQDICALFFKMEEKDNQENINKTPSKMARLAWPKAKYGAIIAIIIIIVGNLIYYKDFFLSIFS